MLYKYKKFPICSLARLDSESKCGGFKHGFTSKILKKRRVLHNVHATEGQVSHHLESLKSADTTGF